MNFEWKAVISAFRYDEDGCLAPIGTVSALPDNCPDSLDMKQSDLCLDPSGRYLYDLLRGIDAVSVFSIDQASGALTRIQTVTLDGTGPRGCAVSPDGRFLCVAALASDEVVTWAIGPDGRLSATGQRISQPRAGSVTFFPPSL